MSTFSAEPHKQYFSFVKVLNRSVDNSVQKPASPIANFPHSNKLMRFALFRGNPANYFSRSLSVPFPRAVQMYFDHRSGVAQIIIFSKRFPPFGNYLNQDLSQRRIGNVRRSIPVSLHV